MDKLKLIYNPFSGNRSFKDELDSCVATLQKGGCEVSLWRTTEKGDIDRHIAEVGKNYDIILAAGGDGTVNIVVNAMMNHGVNAALGIIPSGTANDFATHLGFSGLSFSDVCNIFTQRHITQIDLGLVNGTYFINVCGCGLLPQVSQSVNPNLKNVLGKMSYYIEGIAQIPNFCPIPVRITNSKEVIEEDIYMLLVLNSPGAGSFENIAKHANITDGLLDFVAVKAKPVMELAKLFVNILKGEQLEDPSVIYFTDNNINIQVLTDNKVYKESDIDGEPGPEMPLSISVVKGALKLLTKQ